MEDLSKLTIEELVRQVARVVSSMKFEMRQEQKHPEYNNTYAMIMLDRELKAHIREARRRDRATPHTSLPPPDPASTE